MEKQALESKPAFSRVGISCSIVLPCPLLTPLQMTALILFRNSPIRAHAILTRSLPTQDGVFWTYQSILFLWRK